MPESGRRGPMEVLVRYGAPIAVGASSVRAAVEQTVFASVGEYVMKELGDGRRRVMEFGYEWRPAAVDGFERLRARLWYGDVVEEMDAGREW